MTMRTGWWRAGAACVVMGGLLCQGAMRARAQASTLPSAQGAPVADDGDRGHQLVRQMMAALGGEAWLTRDTARLEGRTGSFFKGAPNPYQTQYEEYLRLAPFGERVVIVSKEGVFIPTTKRDVAEIWTPENGYEVSYHGRKELPRKDVDDFERWHRHSLDAVVLDWLKRPGTIVTFEGSDMDDRHLVDKVSVITAGNDAVTLGLSQETHLPLSLSFDWRDPLYKDFNHDTERYDDWQRQGGAMTAMTVTRYHNGDMVSQRFFTKVEYHVPLSPDVFDPDKPLSEKALTKR